MKKCKVAVLILALTGMILVGCGNTHNEAADKYTTIGTIDKQEISYSLANFAAKYEQAQYEKQYLETLGNDMWSTPMGDGKTLEEGKKSDILTGLEKMIVMAQKADDLKVVLTTKEQSKIKKSAEKFMKDNSNEVIEMMTASQEVVEEYLTYYTLSTKVYERIAAEEKEEKLQSSHAKSKIDEFLEAAEIDIDKEAWASIVFDKHFEIVGN